MILIPVDIRAAGRHPKFRSGVVTDAAYLLLLGGMSLACVGCKRSETLVDGRDKAQALMVDYGKHSGKMDDAHRTFDENNDRSFGDFGFRYFPETNILQARVYIVKTMDKEYPETAAAGHQTDLALNDPSIGGMYDRAGGYFLNDPQKGILFLVRDFNVSQTDQKTFIAGVDALNDIAPMWLIKWGGLVAAQGEGLLPRPTQHIDRDHDPYPRDWQVTMLKNMKK
jgi:hypothetical protein